MRWVAKFLVTVAIIVVSNVGTSVAALADDPPIGIGYEDQGIAVGADKWTVDPSTGKVVPREPGAPNTDPNQYKYELQCHLGGGDFDTPCLARQLECKNGPDGKDGIPVVWLKAPKGIPNPVWTFHSGPTCLFDPKPEDLLPRIAALIQSEFQKLPVAAGTVTAQPSPHTLRGAETNFYADSAEQQFDITILAQKVHVVATPVQYTWNYGDGTTLGPQPSAGGPLPQGRWGEKTRTSHVYTQTGDFQVVLTTHFQGTYSVNNGPPLPIPGQGQFNSLPQTISVWRSVTRNYADDCIRNPQGQGCPGVAPQAP
ncbi:PKD domain-containing protein [Arthrobacter sp. Y81]|uniref:PKD domain-containing protein n=1 Tax=Arthrobacter sp. Y81 TaxID=2058897 RepID=UPI002157F3B2|nr:PKD domain-containing protein [Arthrobacter sp. Y81]